MNARWTWITGIATLAAFILGGLFFFDTATITKHDVLMLLTGVVVGGAVAAFVAAILWYRKPAPASPAQPGQFTDRKQAGTLKKNIDTWERQLVDAEARVEELKAMENASYGLFRKNFQESENRTAEAALKKAELKVEQLRANIKQAKHDRENLRVPEVKPIRIGVPKGRIPRRDGSGR